ncbi:ankyrin repeat-containing domain protein [Baffinella frigidus]|nr:ankyrin repeat-containing domain protein [Cryptophyta sp. CCMP2293]
MAPLWAAAADGNAADVKRLLDAGAPIDQRGDASGSTPLHNSVARTFGVVITRLLVRKGADVKAKNSGGFTPLHIACRLGNEALALLLVQNGADVSAETNKGHTPLWYAIRTYKGGARDPLERLLRHHGAEVAPTCRPHPCSLSLSLSLLPLSLSLSLSVYLHLYLPLPLSLSAPSGLFVQWSGSRRSPHGYFPQL